VIQLDKRIYDSEINICVGWMWDSGIVLRLGDEVGGFIAEEVVETAAFLWSCGECRDVLHLNLEP